MPVLELKRQRKRIGCSISGYLSKAIYIAVSGAVRTIFAYGHPVYTANPGARSNLTEVGCVSCATLVMSLTGTIYATNIILVVRLYTSVSRSRRLGE